MNAQIARYRVWQRMTFAAALTLPVLASHLELAAAPPKGAARAGTQAPEFDVDPSQVTEVKSPSGAGAGVGAGATVRLNYMQAPWDKVLKDYAAVVRKPLKAESFPPGTYSNWDFIAHPTNDGLRILNRELSHRGYRLVDKPDELLLVEMKKKDRPDYPRAGKPTDVSYKSPEQLDAEDEAAEAAEAEAARRTAAQARRAQQAAAAGRVEQAGHSAKTPGRIRQVSGEKEASRAAEPVELKVTSIRMKARDAVAVARIMYKALKPRAEEINEGPRGLPGFRAYHLETDQKGQPIPRGAGTPVSFAIGIDEDRNQLVIEASAKETASVQRLVRMLDVLPEGPEETVRAVSMTKDVGAITSSLRPELQRLASMNRRIDQRAQLERRNARAAVDADGQAPEEEPQPRAQRGAAAPQGDPQTEAERLIQNLRGEVEIESIPELGIILLKGSEADVAAVRAVIDQIEALSAGSVPKTLLRPLKYVDAERMATLLTTVFTRLSPQRGARVGAPGGAAAQQAANVLVIPISRPNSVLIVAAQVDIDSAIDLIEQLDQPGDPRSSFEVFSLKYAVATQVALTVETVITGTTTGAGAAPAQAQNAAAVGLVPSMRIVDDPRTNSVIVVAQPQTMREIARLIRRLDVVGAESASVIRVFPLKTASADELGNTLYLAIQSLMNPARAPTTTQGGAGQQALGQQGAAAGGAGQGAAELREVKATILEYYSENSDEVLRSGLLSDIRITSDLRTNSIIVTAPQQSMDLVAALIARFDKPTSAVADIKVIQMVNGDATATAALLNTLFGTAAQRPAGQQGAGQGGNQAGQNFPGVQFGDAGDFSSSLIPLRFSTDIRTNSIIAIGGAQALEVVEAIVIRLDQGDIRSRLNKVYRLKNSPSASVATSIQQFLTSQLQVQTQVDTNVLSPFEQIEREVVVVSEPVSNSLLISATPRFFKEVLKVVMAIDRPPQQVLIQALLVEVQLDDADEWGVELGLQDSILFTRSLLSNIQLLNTTNTTGQLQTTTQTIVSQEGVPGFAFNNQPLGNNTTRSNTNPATVGSQGLTNFNLGRANADLGYGGLVLAAGSESVSALLRAVAARHRVDVLSRPQVRTLDNQPAQMQVGQEIPRVGNVTVNQTTGNATPVVEQRSIGVILQVTPRVTPDGFVVMNLVARKDALNTQSVPLFINPNGSTINSPIIDTTNALATVSVKTGQTIIVGGMITKSEDTQERKVPLLGDVPILGQAFRYDYKRVKRSELLIFLTPRVLHSDSEAEEFKQIEAHRMNFIEAEAEMIHGPIFGLAPEPDVVLPPQDPMFEMPDDDALVNPTPVAPEVLNAPKVRTMVPHPQPPAPGPSFSPRTVPMSLQSREAPSNRLPAERNQIPAIGEEDLDVDLSAKPRKSRQDPAVKAAGFASRDQVGGRAATPSAGAAKPARNTAKTTTRKPVRPQPDEE